MTTRSDNKVRVVDKGADALVERLSRGATVKVGIIGEKASQSHQGGPLSNVEIGAVHEFGAPSRGIEQRSFIRGYVIENEREIHDLQRKFAREIIKGMPVKQALKQLGAVIEGGIKERIANRIPPPLWAQTVERKGSDVPLINTGQLRSSITHLVEGGD